MKWYQVMECDNTVKNPMVCDYSNIEEYGFDEWSFLAGQEIKDWKNNIVYQAQEPDDDGEPDDALQNADMLPIFSKSLIKELDTNNIKGIQYLPISVLRPNNETIEGFCIANMINFIPAFNYEKSVYSRFPDDYHNPNVRGKITLIKNFVLYKDKLKGFDIIRLADYEQAFFVSERFKEIFEKNKFTGYSFDEVELT